MNNSYFKECDALLLAVISRCSDRNVYKMIATIDFYYRLVPSFEELSSAMVRLQESGLILNKSQGLFCTKEARTLFRSTGGMGMTNLMLTLTERLPEYTPLGKNEVLFEITKEEFDCAINDYLK